MSLYGDLPQAKHAGGGANDASSWAAVNKLQPTIRKAPPVFAPPPSVLRAGRGAGRGPPSAGRGGGRGPPNETDPDKASSSNLIPAHSIFAVNGPVQDEYDPMRPNDYEEVMLEREKKKKEAAQEAEKQARLKELEREREEAEERARNMTDTERKDVLNISGEEAYLRRARLSGRLPPPSSSLPGPPKFEEDDPSGPTKGMTLAQKLLEKMGWKEGEGLGKNRQGINAPLIAQKTDKRSGVIVSAELPPPKRSSSGFSSQGPEGFMMPPPEKRPKMGVPLQGKPTRVICMRNMVGPGEVDDDLEEEVGEELTKYGTVQDVCIFEVTEQGYPAEEAVRIFVKFDRIESATKALVDLQGRFFGGRQVRAGFFSEERMEAEQLAPLAGEFD